MYHNGVSLAKHSLTLSSHIKKAIAFPNGSREYTLGIGTRSFAGAQDDLCRFQIQSLIEVWRSTAEIRVMR